MAATPPPELPDELVEEILLRLPPDDPACLLRASLVCKTWGCAVSHPCFRRRLHELHRTPPVLGFLQNWYNEGIPRFIPTCTTSSSFFLAAPGDRSWYAVDCRHGRALFLPNGEHTKELLVWEPITGAQRRIPMPASRDYKWWQSAAVFCAADGCNHRDCHGGPIHLVFVFFVEDADRVLLGRSLLYFISEYDDWRILKCDLARRGLTVFDPPESDHDDGRFNLMLAEDGGLGLSQAAHQHLKLWSRKASDGTNAQWVLSRVIYLENLLPDGALVHATWSSLRAVSFAEGANVIFVTTAVGVFSIELQSDRVRKVRDNHGYRNLIPVVSFYTPVPCGEH